MSYGRYPDAGIQWRIFDIPTPGEGNDSGYIGIVAEPEFSQERGFYETSLDVAITTETKRSVIYYTLDGSEPKETDVKYTNPIPIDSTTPLRARAFKIGWLPSPVETATYFVNESEAIKSLPVVSIVGDERESLYEPNGIMARKRIPLRAKRDNGDRRWALRQFDGDRVAVGTGRSQRL